MDTRDRCYLIWSKKKGCVKTFRDPQQYTGMGALTGRTETEYHPEFQSRVVASQRASIV